MICSGKIQCVQSSKETGVASYSMIPNMASLLSSSLLGSWVHHLQNLSSYKENKCSRMFLFRIADISPSDDLFLLGYVGNVLYVNYQHTIMKIYTNDDNYENTFYGFLGVKPFHALILSMSGSFTFRSFSSSFLLQSETGPICQASSSSSSFLWKKTFIDQNQPKQEEILFKKELQLQTKANWKQLILHKCQAFQKAAKQALLTTFYTRTKEWIFF